MKTKSEINYADVVKFDGNFELPSKSTNYGGFNYREYLKTKKVYGIVTANKVQVVAKRQLSFLSMFANDIRQKIMENIKLVDVMLSTNIKTENNTKVLGNADETVEDIDDTAGILSGILIGDKSNVSDEVQTNFKNSGLSHLLAISGLHVNYVILAIVFLLNKLKVGKRLASGITIVFIIFFMYITNFTESVVRAGIMGIITLGSRMIYRKNDILTSIALSLLIILIENPYKIFSVGLQLSYAGTLGIVLFYPKLKNVACVKFISKDYSKLESKYSKILYEKIKVAIKDILFVCISAQILILPLMLIHYNSFSSYFLLSNILVSPITGIIIILGFVFVFISFISIKLSMVVYLPLKLILKILILINEFISNLPLSTVLFKTPYLFNVIFYYYIVGFIAFGKKFPNYKKIIAGCVLVLTIFTFVLDYPKESNLYFVDVAQGDCTLVRLKSNKVILIDGGGSESYNVGENVLLPYLLDRRITSIDYMMFSHFDTDHCRRAFNCYGEVKGFKCNYMQTGRKLGKL